MDFSKYIGIPFEDKGRTIDGLDCWGLLWLIFKEQFNIEIPTFLDEYPTATNFPQIGKLIGDNIYTWIEIERDIRKVGDVILLRLFGYPVHVGILVNKQQMIHVFKGTNTCLQRINSIVWKKRIQGIYRHPNLANI